MTADPALDDRPSADRHDDPDEGAPPPRVARTAAIIVGIVLVLFIGLLATRKSADERINVNPIVGKAVPRLVGTTLDGTQLDVDTLRGRWVVVNFFATWCVPCQIEHPELVKFSKAHAASADAQVVSIVFNDQVNATRAFFQKQGGTWPVITSDDGHAAIDFGVTGVPESFVVAPNGLVVAHFQGVTQTALDDVIARFGGTDSVTPGSVAPDGSIPAAGGGR